jgi:hypothetical protein
MPASFLHDTIKNQHLYASERAGFTWGDGVYVTPVEYPLTTMMYGRVGVVGTFDIENARFFNADDPAGVKLYQQWITYQTRLFRELTTTVHANSANRELRNAFRSFFQIDCVLFRPDELCADYVDPVVDWWSVISHWDPSRGIGHGYSKAVKNLKWCLVGPDSFEPDGKGYKSFIHAALSAGRQYIQGHYTSLEREIRDAYAKDHVLICDFN